jgi:hypothetical protein
VGRNRIVWDYRVGGRRLAAGRYLITLRALNRRGQVIALARAARLTIPPAPRAPRR